MKFFILAYFLLFNSTSQASLKPQKPLQIFTEDLFYTRIITAYQKNHIETLKRILATFEAQFPKSLYLDNALYLLGRLHLNQKQYHEALKTFQKILKDFPKGNKLKAALFAKAILYQRMGIYDLAKKTLDQIPKLYPGSLEAQRVELEKEIFKREINEVK